MGGNVDWNTLLSAIMANPQMFNGQKVPQPMTGQMGYGQRSPRSAPANWGYGGLGGLGGGGTFTAGVRGANGKSSGSTFAPFQPTLGSPSPFGKGMRPSSPSTPAMSEPFQTATPAMSEPFQTASAARTRKPKGML